MRCSAFAATGPATRDGKIVFGHITMFSALPVELLQRLARRQAGQGPPRPHADAIPGGIQSGLDYYLNDAGLLVCETTIAQTRFDGKGAPLASRIRQALQYADTIDKAVEILKKDNNGLYTNEWLLGDIKTNEIAMFELGTHKTRLWRQQQGGVVRRHQGLLLGLQQHQGPGRAPGDDRQHGRAAAQRRLRTFRPRQKVAATVRQVQGQDRRRLRQTRLHHAAAGRLLARWTPSSPPATWPNAWRRGRCSARRSGGPGSRRFDERTDYPEVRPLVSNPWTVLTGDAPALSKEDGVKVVDQHDPKGSKLPEVSLDPKEDSAHLTTAWHGTLLPQSDADVWLASAFPSYERYAALEKAHPARLRQEGTERRPARQAGGCPAGLSRDVRAWGRARPEPTLANVRSDLRQNDWHKVAQGKGVLLLHSLREKLGAETFDKMMDDFGTANAGKAVATAQFTASAEKAAGHSLKAFFDSWLTKTGLPSTPAGGPFTVLTFYPDVERTVIVYGTKDEEAVNREAADDLRKATLRRWANVDVPIRSDQTVTAKELAGCHLLLVGRPAVNRITERFANQLPVAFGKGSMVVRGKAYAHADTAVLAAAENPLDRRSSVVVIAGLGAASTLEAVSRFADRGLPAGEVVILQRGKTPHALVVPAKALAKETAREGK